MSFDGIPLPEHAPTDDLSTGEVSSTLMDAFGGSVNFWGQTRRLPRSQRIIFRGTYISKKGRLVDEQGRVLIDKATKSALLSTDQYFSDLRAQTNAVKAKLGYLGRLRRQPEDVRARTIKDNASKPIGQRVDPNTVGLQWKLARLIGVKHERTLADIDRAAILEITFETVQNAWENEFVAHYPLAGSASVTGVDVAEITVDGSEVVNDFIVRIKPVSAPLTRFALAVNGATIRWNDPSDWSQPGRPPLSQPIPVGSEIVIDMGRETITANGGDIYANFAISTIAPGWLYLVPGINNLKIETTGATCAYAVEYYSQWT